MLVLQICHLHDQKGHTKSKTAKTCIVMATKISIISVWLFSSAWDAIKVDDDQTHHGSWLHFFFVAVDPTN